MQELEQLEQMLALLKNIKRANVKKGKLSDKLAKMDHYNSTPKRIGAANANLNWECMNYDKLKVDFARLFKDSCLDVGVSEREYNPSGFHSFKY
jgi:hypothetical protein